MPPLPQLASGDLLDVPQTYSPFAASISIPDTEWASSGQISIPPRDFMRGKSQMKGRKKDSGHQVNGKVRD